MDKKRNLRIKQSEKKKNLRIGLLLSLLFLSYFLNAQSPSRTATNDTDEELINKYIDSKVVDCIVFDANNIKKYWIDRSVISRKNYFEINMEKDNDLFVSQSLKIQLVNVSDEQDCRIEVYSETDNMTYSVLDNENIIIATSYGYDKFLNYNIISSNFHLKDTKDRIFSIRFKSNVEDRISIKKVVLSFFTSIKTGKNEDSQDIDADNDLFLNAPHDVLDILKNNYRTTKAVKIVSTPNDELIVTGRRSDIFSTKRILADDVTFKNTLTIKNIGEINANIYLGYALYSIDNKLIDERCIPYNNKILTVVSSEDNSNKILVDSEPEWKKRCHLAINAKSDLSDFPNHSLIEGTIVDVKKKDNNQYEIFFDQNIKKALKPGTQVRVQNPRVDLYLYTTYTTNLQPGKEITLSSSIKKDNDFYRFSHKALCNGTHYVVPVLLLWSSDNSNRNCSILISKYTVSY